MSRMKLLIHCLFLFCLSTTLLSCKNTNKIDAYLTQKHQEGGLNGNVLVKQNGKTLYEKSFGYTDGSKSDLLTKEHRFEIGSIFKEFPAVAIMQLKEKGLLKLEDPLSQYVSELPQWSEKITIQHLLQYSGGLPTIQWDEYFGKGLVINDSIPFNDLHNIETLEFEPGTDYLYTNYSPLLLEKIVENISRNLFLRYVDENIFAIAGLNHTIIKDQYPYVDKTLMAIPFNSDFKEDSYGLSVPGFLFTSTTHDISTWFMALNSYALVGRESLEFLSTKVKEGEGFESPLGQVIWEDGSLMAHTHHGSAGNYECIARYTQAEDLIIVILTNQKNRNVHELSDRIYELVKE